jgi:hypothetical protein
MLLLLNVTAVLFMGSEQSTTKRLRLTSQGAGRLYSPSCIEEVFSETGFECTDFPEI